MGVAVPIQTSFAGGEASPRLGGRVDTEFYRKAVAYDENWEPLAHGPMLSRGGTQHRALFTDLGQSCRAVPFARQADVGFTLVLGARKLRVRDGLDGGEVRSGGINWIRNPRFKYGWQYWTPEYAMVVNTQYLLRTTARGAQYSNVYGRVYQTTQELQPGDYEVTITGSTAAGNNLIVAAGTAGFGSSDRLLDVIATGGLADKKTITRTIHLDTAAAVTLQLRTANEVAEFVPGSDMEWGAEIVLAKLGTPGGAVVEWNQTTNPPVPWEDEQLEALQVVPEPAKDRIFLFHPEHPPHELLFDRVDESWSFGPIAFTLPSPVAPWNDADSGTLGCYPGVGELYQGRLIVGGIKGKENTILASRSGDPFNFTEGGASAASDALGLDVSTKGSIRWVQGHRTCLIGTDKGEHILTAQGGVVTPSDFEVRAQSGYGSAAVQALHLGEVVVYVSRDRRRLRALSYNLQESGWQSRDLTFTGDHLTGGLFREVHWVSTGNDQIVGVMRSGEVRCWTYRRDEQVVAPWRANFGGSVYSAAVIDSGDQDKVWLLVQRVGGVALEEWDVSDNPNRVLLDAWRSISTTAGIEPVDGGGFVLSDPPAETGTRAFAGLGDLEGQSVVIIADDAMLPRQTVVGGQVTIPASAKNVTVGLYNRRRFVTLRPELGNVANTTQGAKQRYAKLTLRLVDSALPLVNGERAAPDRSPSTPMGSPEERVTKDVTVRVLGWEDGGAVTIEQDLPVRTEILAIFGHVASQEVR